jgi:plastocyanin
VYGTENLEPGQTYEFYCTPHMNSMRGYITAL